MLIFLFPPIYALWILAIGKKLRQKQNKSDKTFTFVASGTIMFFLIAFLISPMLRLFQINWIDINFFNNTIPGLIGILFWILTLGMASSIMVKYEQFTEPEAYHTSIETSISVVVRAVALFYWFISIWFYQKKVNKYNS